jgi:hypothetical protein
VVPIGSARGATPCVSLSAKSTFRGLPRRQEFNFREGLVQLAYLVLHGLSPALIILRNET